MTPEQLDRVTDLARELLAALEATQPFLRVAKLARDLAAVQGTTPGMSPLHPEFWQLACRILDEARKLPGGAHDCPAKDGERICLQSAGHTGPHSDGAWWWSP